jgi:phosphoribosylformimino-5-aminoimidazole carboxamide ribotide isomerase
VFWLDAGFASLAGMQSWPQSANLRLVLGSESQTGLAAIEQLLQQCRPYRPILSLDFKNEQFLGPAGLLEAPDIWPQDVILMKLDRVGGGRGPDTGLPALAGKRFYAAGGVRDKADLEQLSARGYAGVLVASALHDGQLSAESMAEFD